MLSNKEKYKNFLILENYFLKYKKVCFLKYKHFFKVSFKKIEVFLRKYKKVFESKFYVAEGRKFRSFFFFRGVWGWGGGGGSVIIKAYFRENIIKFFKARFLVNFFREKFWCLRPESARFHFQKYKKSLLLRKYKKMFYSIWFCLWRVNYRLLLYDLEM